MSFQDGWHEAPSQGITILYTPEVPDIEKMADRLHLKSAWKRESLQYIVRLPNMTSYLSRGYASFKGILSLQGKILVQI